MDDFSYMKPAKPLPYDILKKWGYHIIDLIENSAYIPRNCHLNHKHINDIKNLMNTIENKKWKKPEMETFWLYFFQNSLDHYYKELVNIGMAVHKSHHFK